MTTTKENRKNKKILYIGLTGKNETYYTKYVETILDFETYQIRHICFHGNLSMSTEKVKKYIEENKSKFDEIIFDESTPMKWSGKQHLVAFGLYFNISKDKKTFYSEPNELFWEVYKDKKEEIKNQGFWLKKTDEGHWLIFKQTESEHLIIKEEETIIQ